MTDYAILDPRFRRMTVGHAKLEKLWTGGRWLEGPAWYPAGRYVVFSDIPNDRLMRYDEAGGTMAVLRHPARHTNGNTYDCEFRLVSCEHSGRAISRTEHNGRVTQIVTHVDGRRLNSPNDVIVKSDGSIWFSDPTYGIDIDYEGAEAPAEIGACHLYRFDPATGETRAVITDREKPNGLAFSPDERILYVTDTGSTHIDGYPVTITAYDVAPDGSSVANPRTFATMDGGLYDGLRIDENGNVWTSAVDGVRCYAPDGTHLGTILVPEMVSNVCFGGAKLNRLFITAQTSFYAIYLAVRGAVRPGVAA
jgi:gluconolactonase